MPWLWDTFFQTFLKFFSTFLFSFGLLTLRESFELETSFGLPLVISKSMATFTDSVIYNTTKFIYHKTYFQRLIIQWLVTNLIRYNIVFNIILSLFTIHLSLKWYFPTRLRLPKWYFLSWRMHVVLLQFSLSLLSFYTSSSKNWSRATGMKEREICSFIICFPKEI